MAQQNRGAGQLERLMARVKATSKRYAEDQARRDGVSLSMWLDRLLESHRERRRRDKRI